MTNRVGQQLGNYRLLRLLGRGGFAEVYLGEHLYLKSYAALKVLRTSLKDADTAQFLAEGQTLARLTHPHIVRVHDFAVEQATPFLVMDYTPGGTLRQRHPPGSCLSLETVVAYVKQIAAALQYAHNRSVIHRDVKPENMLLGAQREVLLSDFGLALFSPSLELLSTQGMAGSLAYVAPEQLRGKPCFASDQYALGIVVYEWLCGVRPFAGSYWQLVNQHASVLPPPLREKDPSLPQAVENVVLRALAKDPEQRYVSVQMFAQALERASQTAVCVLHEDSEGTGPLNAFSPAPPVTPTRVFVSGSPADDAFVGRLQADLKRRGIAVWNGESGSRPSTLDQEGVLRQAIRAVDVVLLVVSPHTRSSRAIKEHLRIAAMYQRRMVCVWAAGEDLAAVLLEACGTTAPIDVIDGRKERYKLALQELVAYLEEEAGTSSPKEPALAQPGGEPRNPYKGLRAFTQDDAADFFGRDTLIGELVDEVKGMLTSEQPGVSTARLLTVIGPSGSGKSSVVRAGLLPRLQRDALPGSQERVYLEPMVPGPHPLEALTLTLASHLPDRSLKSLRQDLEDGSARGLHLLASHLVKDRGKQVVLFIDQFEELFTLTTSEDERGHFIDLLLTATTEPHGPIIVILTLRADFYDRPMAYSELYRLMQAHQKPVLPMETADLRSVIKQPASLPDVQLAFEGSLVGDLLFEVQGQIGALPLLQFTLDQLFQRRKDHLLTLQAYHEIGGVKGAVAKQAEATFAGLPSQEHRKLARALFLRLINPGLTEQDTTRRRAVLSELTLPDPGQTTTLREVADAFIAARLLTTNEIAGMTTLEVSHEALIREWTQLADWLREAREDIPLQQTISANVVEWERRGQPKDRLYRGSQLKEAKSWAKRNIASRNELAFLQASAAHRIRYLVNIVATFLLLVSVTGLTAWLLLLSKPSLTTVTTLKDDGPGSLRQVLITAPSRSTITFDSSLKGTIVLSDNLDFPSNKILTIRGPGAAVLAISGSGDKAIRVSARTTVFISGLSFKGSKNADQSLINNVGGILTLADSIISDNAGVVGVGGGAIMNFGGTLTLLNSTIVGNSVYNGDNGGGIENFGGTLTLIGSTVSGNSVSSDNNADSFGVGGGIYTTGGKLILLNSTIAGNSVSGRNPSEPADGGGIAIRGSDVTVTFCTIYGNTAHGGGGISIEADNRNHKPNRVVIRNTIVAGNHAGIGPDISGNLITYGYNLLQDNSGATFDSSTSLLHSTDKLVSTNDLSRLFTSPLELRYNSGPTATYALASDSPAVDQIPLQYCQIRGILNDQSRLSTDQRGIKRPDDNERACDIGAYEHTD